MQLPTPEYLKKRRSEIGFTLRDLAKRAGLIQPIIARIESGDVNPRLFTVRKILDVFEKAEKVLLTLIRNLIHFPVIHISPADSIEEAVNLMVY
jgi:predicted transcriptional regulator